MRERGTITRMRTMTARSIRLLLAVGLTVTRPVRWRHFYYHTRTKVPQFPMKTFTKVTLLTLGLAAAALPFLAAADTATPSTPAPGAKFPLLRAMIIRRMAVAKRVAKKLGLSSDQIAQLKAL